MSSDSFGKVVDVSLTLALAPGLLAAAYESVERIERLLDSTADTDSIADTVDRSFVRSGFLLLVVARVEDALKESCDDLSLLCPTTLRWKEVAGQSDFDKCQKFLRKGLKLSLPSDASWSTLKSYRDARNTIAHRGRLSFSKDDKRGETVKALPGVDTEQGYVLQLNMAFCRHLLNFATSFIDELHRAAVQLSDAASRGSRA